MSASTMFTVDQVREALGDGLIGERSGDASGFSAVSNDSRVLESGELFVALKTELRDGHDFIDDAMAHGAVGVIVESDDVLLPDQTWAFRVSDTRRAIGDLASYWRRQFAVKTVAIAGNVGKTTTKELTSAVLSAHHTVLKSAANFNDEVGLAMSLFQLNETHDRAVVEVGMFELGEIRRLCEIAAPEISVVLNVGPTHLERLGSIEAIAEAKSEAVQALPSTGTAILNADDPYVAAMEAKTPARVLTFGVEQHAAIRATDLRGRGLAGVDFTLSCLGRELKAHSPLPGTRLVSNALAAVAAAFADGLSIEEANAALAAAEVPLRTQIKVSSGGGTILDDAYNANPASMFAALELLSEMTGRRLALLGDMLELGSAEAESHRAVGEAAARVCDLLFSVGPRGELIAAAARAVGGIDVTHFDTKEEAVSALRTVIGPGDILLVKASHGLALESVVEELCA